MRTTTVFLENVSGRTGKILEVAGIRIDDQGVPQGPGLKGWQITNAITGSKVFSEGKVPALIVLKAMAAAQDQFHDENILETGKDAMMAKNVKRANEANLDKAIEAVNNHNRPDYAELLVCKAKCAVCGEAFAVIFSTMQFSLRNEKDLTCPARECKRERRRQNAAKTK